MVYLSSCLYHLQFLLSVFFSFLSIAVHLIGCLFLDIFHFFSKWDCFLSSTTLTLEHPIAVNCCWDHDRSDMMSQNVFLIFKNKILKYQPWFRAISWFSSKTFMQEAIWIFNLDFWRSPNPGNGYIWRAGTLQRSSDLINSSLTWFEHRLDFQVCCLDWFIHCFHNIYCICSLSGIIVCAGDIHINNDSLGDGKMYNQIV